MSREPAARRAEVRLDQVIVHVVDDVLPVRLEAERAAYEAAISGVPFVVVIGQT